jgi:hypothetical protein
MNTEKFTNFIHDALSHFDELKLRNSAIIDSPSSYDGKVSDTSYYYFADGENKGSRFQITIAQINGDEEDIQNE